MQRKAWKRQNNPQPHTGLRIVYVLTHQNEKTFWFTKYQQEFSEESYLRRWAKLAKDRILPRECTGHSKHSLPTTQEKTLHMDITRWSTPKSDWLYSLQPKMEKLYTGSKSMTKSWLGSDHEILKAKFRLKLKKAGEITRPFRYDLNKIPYNYTVEVTNRFKGLDW